MKASLLFVLSLMVMTTFANEEELGNVVAIKRTIEVTAAACLNDLKYKTYNDSYQCKVDSSETDDTSETLVKARTTHSKEWTDWKFITQTEKDNFGKALFTGIYTPTGYMVTVTFASQDTSTKEHLSRKAVVHFLGIWFPRRLISWFIRSYHPRTMKPQLKSNLGGQFGLKAEMCC